jgi:hypothetical protein
MLRQASNLVPLYVIAIVYVLFTIIVFFFAAAIHPETITVTTSAPIIIPLVVGFP